MVKFSRLIGRIRSTLTTPDDESLIPHYEALIELQDKLDQVIQTIQPNKTYPRADELSLIRYHNRFEWLIGEIVDRARRDKTTYRFYLTPGHPESERLHSVELEQLKELGYRVRIIIDDDYEAIISW